MPTDLPAEKFWGWCECECHGCDEYRHCHGINCHMPKTYDPNEQPQGGEGRVYRPKK